MSVDVQVGDILKKEDGTEVGTVLRGITADQVVVERPAGYTEVECTPLCFLRRHNEGDPPEGVRLNSWVSPFLGR